MHVPVLPETESRAVDLGQVRVPLQDLCGIEDDVVLVLAYCDVVQVDYIVICSHLAEDVVRLVRRESRVPDSRYGWRAFHCLDVLD